MSLTSESLSVLILLMSYSMRVVAAVVLRLFKKQLCQPPLSEVFGKLNSLGHRTQSCGDQVLEIALLGREKLG